MSDRKTQFDKALLGLRSLVMSGEFAASARLPEVALAERLGISRTPLRQAMDRLVAEGLLERIETGGCRVARFTIEDVIDAIEIRGVIGAGVAVALRPPVYLPFDVSLWFAEGLESGDRVSMSGSSTSALCTRRR